ncbi:MAG: ribonuclease III [Spirochaetae bacterium HGW-Spirochaetae-9]|nr:MAG: ribonuclease III [Spirochaetae bacterium HGW-Spirochaetae-9]
MTAEEFSPRQLFLEDFQKKLQLSFNNLSLLDSSLTHRSFLNESHCGDGLTHNERLEFLGDAVLGQVVASLLFARLDGRPEGELARIKSIVVSEQSLAPIALAIGIPEALQLGRGEEHSGGRSKKALLADAVEALIGAVFLDQGYDAAQLFVSRLVEPVIEEAVAGKSKDYKTVIQEYAQKHYKELPLYTLDRAEGPEHDRIFWVSCKLGRKSYGPFSGKTKKEAEQMAAENIYFSLKKGSDIVASRLDAITSLSPQ